MTENRVAIRDDLRRKYSIQGDGTTPRLEVAGRTGGSRLFSNETFAPGAVVTFMDGTPIKGHAIGAASIAPSQAVRTVRIDAHTVIIGPPKPAPELGAGTFIRDPHVFLEPDEREGGFRVVWPQHAAANAKLKKEELDGHTIVWVVATKPIDVGDEITVNLGPLAYWQDFAAKLSQLDEALVVHHPRRPSEGGADVGEDEGESESEDDSGAAGDDTGEKLFVRTQPNTHVRIVFRNRKYKGTTTPGGDLVITLKA